MTHPFESEHHNTVVATLLECVVNDLRTGATKPNSYGASLLAPVGGDMVKQAVILTGDRALRDLRAGVAKEVVMADMVRRTLPSVIGMLQHALAKAQSTDQTDLPAPQVLMAPMLLMLASIEVTTQMIVGHLKHTRDQTRKPSPEMT